MESQIQPCKIAAAAAMIVLLLLTNGTRGGHQGLPAVAGEEQCTAVRRSTTFKGDCIRGANGNEAVCNYACRHEGDAKGYCFTDFVDPDHPACMCSSPCTPPASTSTTPGSMA
ncbi:hypothetical protein ACP4OV_009767 [Aristida adscensionis]